MAAPSTVQLLELEPDIARFLTDEERAAAEELIVPVRAVPKGELSVSRFLRDANAFGGLLVEGMVLQGLRVGDQVALRLLGQGDILSLGGTSESMLLAETMCRASAGTQVAILGNEVLRAAHRWPRIVAGLSVRMAEQSDRLATQLAICQLPRVDQRLLAMMWLLAESWGQVKSAGTTLPLTLTHDTLGGLVGARRPTVTLALGELTDRGAIVRQDRGWLLLEPPPASSGITKKLEEPRLLDGIGSTWLDGSEQPHADIESQRELQETVMRLREEHARNVERFNQRIRRLASLREACIDSRRKLTGSSRQRQAPSG